MAILFRPSIVLGSLDNPFPTDLERRERLYGVVYVPVEHASGKPGILGRRSKAHVMVNTMSVKKVRQLNQVGGYLLSERPHSFPRQGVCVRYRQNLNQPFCSGLFSSATVGVIMVPALVFGESPGAHPNARRPCMIPCSDVASAASIA